MIKEHFLGDCPPGFIGYRVTRQIDNDKRQRWLSTINNDATMVLAQAQALDDQWALDKAAHQRRLTVEGIPRDPESSLSNLRNIAACIHHKYKNGVAYYTKGFTTSIWCKDRSINRLRRFTFTDRTGFFVARDNAFTVVMEGFNLDRECIKHWKKRINSFNLINTTLDARIDSHYKDHYL